MAKKKKQFVWHKRCGKFISPHAIKSPTHQNATTNSSDACQNSTLTQKQKISQKLSSLIKKAIREEHKLGGG